MERGSHRVGRGNRNGGGGGKKTKTASRIEKKLGKIAMKKSVENQALIDGFIMDARAGNLTEGVRIGFVKGAKGGGRFEVELPGVPGTMLGPEPPTLMPISGGIGLSRKAARHEEIDITVAPGKYVLVEKEPSTGVQVIIAVFPPEDARRVLRTLGMPYAHLGSSSENINIALVNAEADEAAHAAHLAEIAGYTEALRKMQHGTRRRSSSGNRAGTAAAAAAAGAGGRLSSSSSNLRHAEAEAARAMGPVSTSERERRQEAAKKAKQARRTERRKASKAAATATGAATRWYF
jgi:hypothetical protein